MSNGVKERGILFSAPMVQAILAGRKTQTRRMLAVQDKQLTFVMEGKLLNVAVGVGEGAYWLPFKYGRSGDRLWVRETWRGPAELDARRPVNLPRHAPIWFEAGGKLNRTNAGKPGKLRPSIFLPRWAARITLEVVAVRVERLQDISEADAKAEGLACITKDGASWKYGIPDSDGLPGTDDHGWPWQRWSRDPRVAYQTLWESINGAGSWAANPWVWVIEFRRVEG